MTRILITSPSGEIPDAELKNKLSFGADMKRAISIVVLSFLLFTVAFYGLGYVDAAPNPHTGDIRITPDGTVEGTDKISRNGNVYTLSGDISGSVDNVDTLISIEKNDVVFDGAGRTIQGTGTGVAITVHGRRDVTIKNTRIVNFGTGIELRVKDFESNSTASNNQILDNYLESTYWGITLNTNSGVVSDNTIVSKNSIYGVNFQSNNTIFSNNAFVNGGLVLFESYVQNIFSGNTINGKPLVYLENKAGQVIDDAEQVFLINCSDMIIRNVNPSVNLRVTITLFGTSNTKVTNCKGNIVLQNSNSNTITNNELTGVGSMASYDASAAELSTSHNNTVTQNSIVATSCYGVSLVGSSYNKVRGNNISSTGQAGVRVESTPQFHPEFNYIHENRITCTENGIYFRYGVRKNVVFKNTITGCENAVMLSSGYENTFVGNNLSGSTQYAVYFHISDNNIFFHNNFLNNAKQAYESHHVYGVSSSGNMSYYSENNMWDNGKEGNYWSDYTGSDSNGDGIGETPYTVYENFTDRYPLTTPFDISSVRVDFAEWVPQSSPGQPPSSTDGLRIIILSPENTTYNTTSLPLDLFVSQPFSWLGYCLDSQSNVTINGNTTLTILSPGTHNLTVYGNTTQGVTASSETIFFTVNAAESFPTVTVVAVYSVVVVGISIALWAYPKRYKRQSSP